MSEAFLKRAVKKCFEALGYAVKMRRIRLGNTEIDGEALGPKGPFLQQSQNFFLQFRRHLCSLLKLLCSNREL